MFFSKPENFKFKLLSLEELIINLDRLTRFKLPDESYFRVFYSILYKNLIIPKYTKTEIERLSPEVISNYVKIIWNTSVKSLFPNKKVNFIINKTIKLIIKKQFKNIEKSTKKLIDTKLLLSPIIEKINYDTAPYNLKVLIKANQEFKTKNSINYEKLIRLREKFNLKFPVEKLLIVEGITEENLLPVFANRLHHNFDKEGIYILGAGGKSKSPDIYLKLKNKLKTPVILLFDSDAKEICELLKQNLLKKDKTIIINRGEFEDILSLNLLKRSLNREYNQYKLIIKKDLQIYKRMCHNIEHYYKTRKLGEFKKAKLSKIVAQNVKYNTDITDEVRDIIDKIIIC